MVPARPAAATSGPAVLGLVADDLTGAGDAAVGFAEAGWTALLSVRPSRLSSTARPGPTVLAVTTGSRALPDDEAAARTAQAVAAVVAAGAERLYLKIDSTVRGSVAGQVDGALAAWSVVHPDARAVICPAFPAHLRTVVDGQALVAGVPLGASAAAHDPVTPRTSGDLAQVFPGTFRRPAADPVDVSGPPGSRLLVDAHGDPDLDQLARGLDAAGPAVVMVGSGGLAAALGRRWAQPDPLAVTASVDGRVLVAVSSLHPATTAQLQQLRTGPSASVVEVLTTGAETTSPAAAAAELARRVRAALAGGRYDALVAVGGDGAAAILAELAADGIEIVGAVVPGCPTGYVSGGYADGLRLVTRSGGFGSAAALDQIIRRLRTTRAGLPTDHHLQAGPRPSPKEAP
ncbi:MAG: four-carbon acid sugar kinase family protein [Janthinobacterium lividum]